MINRVVQLNNSQLESSFNSLLEKHLVLNLPNQPNPLNPISDRTGKPVTQEIVGKLQGERSSSDRTGEPVKDEDKRVMKDHDRTGKPVEASSHKVQEVGSLEHRDDADKFNLAMDDESIDFNISGVPNAMVKRSHSINVHNLIQQIENHPQRQALQDDLQQHHAFNPFSKESKDAIMAAGNTELYEIVDVEPKSQCRACLTYLGRWHRLLHVRTLLCKMIQQKTRSTSHPCWICFPSRTSTSGRPATRSQVREETWMQRVPHGKTTSKEVSKEEI